MGKAIVPAARGAGDETISFGRRCPARKAPFRPRSALPCIDGLGSARFRTLMGTHASVSPENGGIAAGGGGVIPLARRALRLGSRLSDVSIGMLCVRSRLLFAAQRQKKGQLARCYVSIPRGSESPFRAFSDVLRLSGFAGSLRACAFLAGDSDGVTRARRVTGNGVGGGA